jgi:hypothetical protein
MVEAEYIALKMLAARTRPAPPNKVTIRHFSWEKNDK